MRLDGKVAFVTGSTRGIGWATARLLAQSGAEVVLHGRTDSDLLQCRAVELGALRANGETVLYFGCELTDTPHLKQCYAEIFKRFRRLDILVNNAGVMEAGVIGMITAQSVATTLEINTTAAIVSLQEAARLMMRNKSGSIVNLASIMATRGGEGYAVYSASKAALIGLTKAVAKELAPKNIRVNAVAPGLIRTDMTAGLGGDQFRKAAERIKMGRIGEPEDVANTILFLASDQSAYVTGQVIGVDGGMCA